MTTVVPNLTVINITPDPRIFNERPNGEASIKGILCHHTGGVNSLAYLSQYHTNPVSIHKLVPKTMPGGGPGHFQLVPDALRAWHAGVSDFEGSGDWNDLSIGIEIENMGDGRDPYTDEQYETVAQIVVYQCALHRIGDHWVRRHAEVALPPGRKSDTDPSFSLGRVWARVAEIRANWPAGWPPMWMCNK